MPKRLLIIEDDPDIQEVLYYIFCAEGYEVTLSENGNETEDLQYPFPDLILMDVQLNDALKNGDDICLMLKSEKATCDLPIILLSAECDLQSRSLACGADGFLCKPFDIEKIISMVKEMIDMSQ